MEMTRKCPICERPYKVYAFSAADQSACRACVSEAERLSNSPTPEESARYRLRRDRFFGGP